MWVLANWTSCRDFLIMPPPKGTYLRQSDGRSNRFTGAACGASHEKRYRWVKYCVPKSVYFTYVGNRPLWTNSNHFWHIGSSHGCNQLCQFSLDRSRVSVWGRPKNACFLLKAKSSLILFSPAGFTVMMTARWNKSGFSSKEYIYYSSIRSKVLLKFGAMLPR